MNYWIKEVQKNAPEDVAMILVGNKSDLPDPSRKVSKQIGEATANLVELMFVEVSAKLPTNFHILKRIIGDLALIKNKARRQRPNRNTTVKLNRPQEKQKNDGCC